MSASHQNLDHGIGIALARAEAEVFAAESCIAMVDARVKALSSSIAHLKALALQLGLRRPEPISEDAPPPIDDLTRERARRALARSGFVRVTP